MKKLPILLLTLLMALSLFQPTPASPAQAEDAQYAIITLTSSYGNKPTLMVENAEFLRWLRALLTMDVPCEALEYRPANRVYEVAFYGETQRTYTVTHNDLYNLATVTRPDGTVHSVSVDLPEMLGNGLYEQVSFSIPESHRALLQKSGWTVAFRHPHMLVQLPKRLETSRTDPAALHFTWADLFLRDAGYDITPYLGRAVVPYVYTVYETMPRAAFYTDDTGNVRYSMYAVVLECDGQIIGAYLKACSLDGSNLMSLKGNAAPSLLGGESVRDYLLGRLPMTAQERELAALTPEEVIIRYGAVNDPALMAMEELLSRLGTASSTLYDPLALAAAPTGDTVTVLRRLDLPDEHMYEAETANGSRYPQLVYESPETGWKIVSYYNTGF